MINCTVFCSHVIISDAHDSQGNFLTEKNLKSDAIHRSKDGLIFCLHILHYKRISGILFNYLIFIDNDDKSAK